MKKLLSLVSVFLLCVSLVACSSNEADKKAEEKPAETPSTETEVPVEEKSEPVTFRFSWWGGDSRHEATLKVIDLYTEKNPHVTIVPEYAAWSGFQEKFTTQFAGKTEADLMQVNYNWLQIYSPEGEGFYNLDDLSNLVDLSNYNQTILEKMTVNGKLQAIPTSLTARVLFLNRTLYDKAGIDFPTTWDELMAAGNTIKEQVGEGNFALSKLGKAGMMYLVFSYLEQLHGKPFLAEDGTIIYSVEELAAGYQLLLDMVANNVMPDIQYDSNELDEKNPLWIEGNYGGINEWDSSVSKYLDTLAEGQIVEPISSYITMDGAKLSGVIQKPSLGFAISKNSKCPEEVAKFLSFMLTDPEAVEIIGTQRGIPANSQGYAVLQEKGLLTGMSVEAYNVHSNMTASIMHPFFEHTDVRNLYEGVGEEVLYGKLNPTEAAQKVIDQMPKIMDEAMGR